MINYICDALHGFMSLRSISKNLVEIVSECLNSIDKGKQVDFIYTDLKAAIDNVSIDIL